MVDQTVPDELLTKIKTMAGITDSAKDDWLKIMIPLLIDQVGEQCNNSFDINDLPSGMVLYLEKAVEFNMSDVRLKSRSMGNVSYTFNTEFPVSVTILLRPYKRMRFRCL
jgi:Phage QLRG family, putative DNA packaging.